MTRPASLRIRDALDAMEAAERFIDGASHAFEGDEKTLYAVEYCFIVIGEALRHVPDDVRSAHPEVPWRDIAGMRNRIAHDYLGVDRELIWQTVTDEFPTLRPLLHRALADSAGGAVD